MDMSDNKYKIDINGNDYWDGTPEEETAYLTWYNNMVKRDNILFQLDEIDRKSIRPAREGETARLAELTAQAVALRAQL